MYSNYNIQSLRNGNQYNSFTNSLVETTIVVTIFTHITYNSFRWNKNQKAENGTNDAFTISNIVGRTVLHLSAVP